MPKEEVDPMDVLLEAFKLLFPTIAVVFTMSAYYPKLARKEDIRELREEIKETRARIDELIENMGVIARKIYAKMEDNKRELNDKIDASTRELRMGINKLAEKIEANTRELRADIKELNQDYKRHLERHEDWTL